MTARRLFEGISLYENPIVAGFPAAYWVALFKASNSLLQGGVSFHSWPDGSSQLEQEEVTIQIFQLIKEEWLQVLIDRAK